jgi:hypothetical protein
MGRPAIQTPDPAGRIASHIAYDIIGAIPRSIKAEFQEEARERRQKLDREAAERRRREGGG